MTNSMRQIIDTVQEGLGMLAEEEQPPFIECLHDAVDSAQVGFYFEEGGCWGMALALYDRFRQMHIPAEIVVSYHNKRPSHAMVRSKGKLYDYTGEVRGDHGNLGVVTPEQLTQIADESGYGEEVMPAKEEANEIIDVAIELASHQ